MNFMDHKAKNRSYGRLAAEVYDLDKPVGKSFGDVEFYRERLSGCKGNILEPGVGTGRILVPLLESGLSVDGMDCSEEMLAICRKNCTERCFKPDLQLGDMVRLQGDKTFEAIIIPAGSFLLIIDNIYSSLSRIP